MLKRQKIVVFVLLVSFVARNAYVNNMPTVGDSIALSNYQAYSGEQVATLDAPSDFTLTQDLAVIDCATALYPVVSGFVQAVYPEGEYPSYDATSEDAFPVYCSGTSSAYENLINGKVDVIFVAGPSENQQELAKDAGVELIMTPIGREAFVFFVNSKNPVDNLEIEEVQQIYTGEITNWKDVGGRNVVIKAFQRNENSGSQTALQRLMQGEELMAAPTDDTVSLMEGIIEKVSDYKNFKNAIGFSFRFYSTEMVRNDEIKLLKLNDISPTKETIRDGTYPISSAFYAITIKKNNRNVEAFIEWILSPQGQFLIEETGYVSIN